MIQTVQPLDSCRIDYLPTPEEIRAGCDAIRQRWSRGERRRRYVGPHLPDEFPPTWQPPTIDTSFFNWAMSPSSEAS